MPIVFSRVKERSSNLPLLIKPYRPISSIRLSSGVSHCRRWISPSVSVLSSYSTIFILVNQMAFYRYFSDAYLSGIHLSDWCYRVVNLDSIQTRIPSLSRVLSSHSRPLHPAIQVLWFIGLTVIATMGSSDFSQCIALAFP